MNRPVALSAVTVTKRYGTVTALDRVTVDLYPGEIHALVGENGAGKSTLVRLLCGVEQPDSGAVESAFPNGVAPAVVPQHPRFAGSLSLWRNLIAGQEPSAGPILKRPLAIRHLEERAAEYGLDIDVRRPAAGLNQSEIRIAATLAAIASNPAVLILDEPTVGLAEADKSTLFSVMRCIADAGKAVLFVSHNLEEVAQRADRVTVLSKGRNVTSRPGPVDPQELKDLLFSSDQHPTTREGSTHEGSTQPNAQPDVKPNVAGAPGIRFENFTVVDNRSGRTLGPLTGDIPAGTVAAVLGLRDAGIDILEGFFSGQMSAYRGSVTVGGYRLPSRLDPSELRKIGLAFLPSDRMTRTATLTGSVEDNLIVVDRRRFHPAGVRHTDSIRAHTRGLLSRFNVVADTSDPMGDLSGGTIQKLILGRELAAHPKTLVLSSPGAGLDVASQERLRTEIESLTNQGGTVLLLSTELEETERLARFVWVLYNGRKNGSFRVPDRDSIAAAMTGLAERPSVRSSDRSSETGEPQ